MKKILLTSRTLPVDEDSMHYNRVAMEYANAIYEVGAMPIVLPSILDETLVNEYVEMCDGVLFTGGEDVNPNLYKEDITHEMHGYSKVRDDFETLLLKAALDKNKPILGICRGMQFINVYFGGTLYQDLKSAGIKENHSIPANISDPVHRINIKKDSILYKYFGDTTFVNTYHHQAVKTIAEDFKATSHSNAGVVESMEYTGEKYIHLVQFHPEMLSVKHKEFLAIFKDFVDRA